VFDPCARVCRSKAASVRRPRDPGAQCTAVDTPEQNTLSWTDCRASIQKCRSRTQTCARSHQEIGAQYHAANANRQSRCNHRRLCSTQKVWRNRHGQQRSGRCRRFAIGLRGAKSDLPRANSSSPGQVGAVICEFCAPCVRGWREARCSGDRDRLCTLSSSPKHGFTPVSALTLLCLESSNSAWGIHIR